MDANDDEQNDASLPPNYVSLADLQQRWLKQQEQKRSEKEKEKCEPQKPNPAPQYQTGRDDDAKQQERRREKEEEESELQQPNLNLGQQDVIRVEDVKKKPQFRNSKNPNLYNRGPIRRNYRNPKGPQEYRLVRNNNPVPKQSKMEGDVMVVAEIDGGDGTRNDQVDGEQKGKVERKMHKKKKKMHKKKNKMQNPATEEQTPAKNGECGEKRDIEVKQGGEAPLKPAMEVGEKLNKLSVKGTFWRTNGQWTKPASYTECREARENQVKGSCETPVKPAMGNQTVEVEEKFKKLAVSGWGWKSKGRSRAVIEGSNRTYRAYGVGEYRRMRTMSSEHGLVWVKKGEVPEHTSELKL